MRDRPERGERRPRRAAVESKDITLFYVIITYNHVMAAATPDNPFVYGEIVTAAAFADREDERERLGRDLASGQKVFLISPRRYGKSSLVRDVMRSLARQKILTIEVTVAVIELVHRLPRVLRAGAGRGRHAGRPAEAVDHRPVQRDQAGDPLRRRPHSPRLRGKSARQIRARLSRGADRARYRARRRGGVRAAGADRRGAQAAPRHRARRVPGDHRLRRRHRRERAARRRAGSTPGRLRVLRLGAIADGADARPAAALLQGRAGDAPREDQSGRVRGLHRRSASRAAASAPRKGSANQSSISPPMFPTTCSGSRTRPGTT